MVEGTLQLDLEPISEGSAAPEGLLITGRRKDDGDFLPSNRTPPFPYIRIPVFVGIVDGVGREWLQFAGFPEGGGGGT